MSQESKHNEPTAPLIRVVLPHALRSLAASTSVSTNGELGILANSVRALLAELACQLPEVHVRVCDEGGDPRPHINVFVNQDHIRARAGLDTRLSAGDLVMILPAVSGG